MRSIQKEGVGGRERERARECVEIRGTESKCDDDIYENTTTCYQHISNITNAKELDNDYKLTKNMTKYDNKLTKHTP